MQKASPHFCQQETIPINNYSVKIVQNKLFEDVPSLYMADHTHIVIDVLCVPCRFTSLFWALVLWVFKQRLLIALAMSSFNKGDPYTLQSCLGSGWRHNFAWFSPVPSDSLWFFVGFSSELSLSIALVSESPSGVLLPKNWPHATTDAFLWLSRAFSHSCLRSLRGLGSANCFRGMKAERKDGEAKMGLNGPTALLWAGPVCFLSSPNCLPEIPWLTLCWTNIHCYTVFWNFLGKVKAFHLQFS